jgi:hypothetical protein
MATLTYTYVALVAMSFTVISVLFALFSDHLRMAMLLIALSGAIVSACAGIGALMSR